MAEANAVVTMDALKAEVPKWSLQADTNVRIFIV
jgi:hypothetical protein